MDRQGGGRFHRRSVPQPQPQGSRAGCDLFSLPASGGIVSEGPALRGRDLFPKVSRPCRPAEATRSLLSIVVRARQSRRQLERLCGEHPLPRRLGRPQRGQASEKRRGSHSIRGAPVIRTLNRHASPKTLGTPPGFRLHGACLPCSSPFSAPAPPSASR